MLTNTRDDLFGRYRAIIESGKDEWASEPYAQDVRNYAAPAVLEAERNLLFRGSPLIVAMSADVPDSSSAFSTQADGVPLLIVRDRKGIARVFVNACRHRGTKVFEGRTSVPPVMTCPYHAWSYKHDGTLHKRPQGESCFAGIATDSLALRQLPAAEAFGVIVARLDGQGFDVDEWAGSIGPELDSYGLDSYVHIETRHHSWDFNWKLALDTFFEAYHVFSLHKDTIDAYIATWPMIIEPRGRHMLTMTPWKSLEDETDPSQILKQATIQHVVFPNTIIAHQIDHVETWSVYPDGDDPTRCVITTSLYAPRAPETDKERARWGRALDVLLKVITTEDFPQTLSIQHAINSGFGPDTFLFGQNEPGLMKFHRQLGEVLAAGVNDASTDADAAPTSTSAS